MVVVSLNMLGIDAVLSRRRRTNTTSSVINNYSGTQVGRRLWRRVVGRFARALPIFERMVQSSASHGAVSSGPGEASGEQVGGVPLCCLVCRALRATSDHAFDVVVFLWKRTSPPLPHARCIVYGYRWMQTL